MSMAPRTPLTVSSVTLCIVAGMAPGIPVNMASRALLTALMVTASFVSRFKSRVAILHLKAASFLQVYFGHKKMILFDIKHVGAT